MIKKFTILSLLLLAGSGCGSALKGELVNTYYTAPDKSFSIQIPTGQGIVKDHHNRIDNGVQFYATYAYGPWIVITRRALPAKYRASDSLSPETRKELLTERSLAFRKHVERLGEKHARLISERYDETFRGGAAVVSFVESV